MPWCQPSCSRRRLADHAGESHCSFHCSFCCLARLCQHRTDPLRGSACRYRKDAPGHANAAAYAMLGAVMESVKMQRQDAERRRHGPTMRVRVAGSMPELDRKPSDPGRRPWEGQCHAEWSLCRSGGVQGSTQSWDKTQGVWPATAASLRRRQVDGHTDTRTCPLSVTGTVAMRRHGLCARTLNRSTSDGSDDEFLTLV